MHFLENYTQKEKDEFKKICNQLLGHTFVVRTNYVQDKGRISNPDYIFISTHFNDISTYLSVLDWDLRQDEFNGYFYVTNTDEANRCNLLKTPTAILLALRMIYDENQQRMGLEHDVICTVKDVLEKIVTDYAILSARPNMDEVKRGMTYFENHCIIQCIDGRYNQASCKFAILPTIMTAVSSEKLEAVVSQLRKEKTIEEINEDITD